MVANTNLMTFYSALPQLNIIYIQYIYTVYIYSTLL